MATVGLTVSPFWISLILGERSGMRTLLVEIEITRAGGSNHQQFRGRRQDILVSNVAGHDPPAGPQSRRPVLNPECVVSWFPKMAPTAKRSGQHIVARLSTGQCSATRRWASQG